MRERLCEERIYALLLTKAMTRAEIVKATGYNIDTVRGIVCRPPFEVCGRRPGRTGGILYRVAPPETPLHPHHPDARMNPIAQQALENMDRMRRTIVLLINRQHTQAAAALMAAWQAEDVQFKMMMQERKHDDTE